MHACLADLASELGQNAWESGASRIFLRVREAGERVEIECRDNGCGMDAATAGRVFDPRFSDARKHPDRRFGLGLPFVKQTAEATGGDARLETRPGNGCAVIAVFGRRHVDLPPLGDLPAAFAGLMAFEGEYELTIERERDGRSYRVRRSELRAALGELRSAPALSMAKDWLASHEEAAQGKGNHHGSNDT